ncbi:hypothetical protein D3C81_1748210 [compost metagenome]
MSEIRQLNEHLRLAYGRAPLYQDWGLVQFLAELTLAASTETLVRTKAQPSSSQANQFDVPYGDSVSTLLPLCSLRTQLERYPSHRMPNVLDRCQF